MADPIAVSASWAPGAAVALLLLATVAAALDAALETRVSTLGSWRGALTRPLDETARLLRQRRRAPVSADVLLWRAGGGGLLVVALLMVTLVPLDRWVLNPSTVGVVWFNALDVAVWALIWLTGWGANSAHGLVGGHRFLALALGYELPLMFALVAPAVAAGSLDVAAVAAAQGSLWFVVWMPVAFVVYCLGVAAFSVWGPFAPPAGADIAGGVLAELSGPDRLLVHAGRYALLAAGAAFAVPMFLGGGAGPVLPGWLWVTVKTVLVLAALVALRRRVPALRPDLFLEVGWMVLLPAVLVQDLVVAVVAVGQR